MAQTIASVGILGLMVAVVSLDLGFGATFGAVAIAQLSLTALVLPMAHKALSETSWSSGLVRHVWSASVTLWGVTLVQAVHWRVGLLTVQTMAGSQELGLFSAAFKLVENLRVIPWFVFMAALPAFVNMGQGDRRKLAGIVRQAVRFALLLGFPLSAVLVILSPPIIELLYTAEYARSVVILRICAVGVLPLFGVSPNRWTPILFRERSPRCQERERRIRRSSGNRWSSWSKQVVRLRS